MISNEENIIAWNSYFYPHTDTFINKLNIKDKAELQKKDASISLKKLNILLLNSDNVTIFDSNYLKSIHYFIFNELYPWAGIYRIVYMAKNFSCFSSVEEIERNLTDTINIMNTDIEKVTNPNELISFVASNYISLQNIHPFREGNGRAIKAFMTIFIQNKTRSNNYLGPYTIDWGKIDNDALNKAMPLAKAFPGSLEQEFKKALKPCKSKIKRKR